MCHETKPHLKVWLSLTNPTLLKSFNTYQDEKNINNNSDDNQKMDHEQTSSSSKLSSSILYSSGNAEKGNEKTDQQVPLLLRDPIAVLLLLISNMPVDLDQSNFPPLIF